MRVFNRRWVWLVVAVIGAGFLSFCLAVTRMQRPRTVSSQSTGPTETTSGTGKIIKVRPGGDLQAALNTAQPGDTIELAAGATYVGSFTLPVKSGTSYITIQSSRAIELTAGVRVSPSQSRLMAKLQSNSAEAVVKTVNGSHHYQFVGIEFTTGNAGTINYGVVSFGDGDTSGTQRTLDVVPHHLTIDRCYIHGLPGQNVQRGVALNSAETSVLNSYISEIHWNGADTQALGGWNGPGPFHIVNNYLEAAGENILFGGAVSAIPNLVPADIEIRQNYFFKPLSWKADDPSYAGYAWSVKNLLELKSARRVVIDGNVFENNWAGSQAGFGILFTVANDSGSWAQIEDVQFTNNVLRKLANGLNMRGRDNVIGSQLRRVTIRNNLFESVSGTSGQGILFQVLRGPVDVTIDHNTAFNSGTTVMFDVADASEIAQNFTYTNNIANHNAYGVFGSGGTLGTQALNRFTHRGIFKRNVLANLPDGISGDQYPPENFFLDSINQVNFLNATGGDYHLAPTSKFKGRGTEGSDIGCDLEKLNAAVSWFKSNR